MVGRAKNWWKKQPITMVEGAKDCTDKQVGRRAQCLTVTKICTGRKS